MIDRNQEKKPETVSVWTPWGVQEIRRSERGSFLRRVLARRAPREKPEKVEPERAN